MGWPGLVSAMSKLYRVEITRVSYQQAEVEIEAENEYEAEKTALETVSDDQFIQREANVHVAYIEPLEILVIPPNKA